MLQSVREMPRNFTVLESIGSTETSLLFISLLMCLASTLLLFILLSKSRDVPAMHFTMIHNSLTDYVSWKEGRSYIFALGFFVRNIIIIYEDFEKLFGGLDVFQGTVD